MRVVILTSKEPMEYDVDILQSSNSIRIAYYPSALASPWYDFTVDSNLYGLDKVLEVLPAWSESSKKTNIILYTFLSPEQLQPIIEKLEEMHAAFFHREKGQMWYFQTAYLICDVNHLCP